MTVPTTAYLVSPMNGPKAPIEPGRIPESSFADAMCRVSDGTVPGADPTARPAGSDGAAPPQTRMHAEVQRLLQDEQNIDELLQRSLTGDSMSPRELLSVQALVYGYTQRVELATKIVDRMASGMKTLLQMQV